MLTTICRIKNIANKKLTETECGTVKFNGVSNISVADLEEIILYCDAVSEGTIHELMPPRGYVAKVFESYNCKFWR